MTEVLYLPSEQESTLSPSGRIERVTLLPDETNLAQRAVLLQLTISAWGINRRLKDHQYRVDANQKMTRAGKKLINSPELQAVLSLDSACRDFVASRSLPSQFKKGIYLQPIETLLEVDGHILSYKPERERLMEIFFEAYPMRVEEAKVDLRSLFDPKNYPEARRLRRRFSVRHDYLELVAAPGSLKAVSGQIFAREQEKIARHWQQALEEARQLLRAQMATLVDHMVDRLSPGEDGKPRIFRDSLVSNMEEWLSTFSARNLTDDRELSALVERARELLHPVNSPDVTADALRSAPGLRGHLQQSFTAIRQQLDGLVMPRPGRRIRLEE